MAASAGAPPAGRGRDDRLVQVEFAGPPMPPRRTAPAGAPGPGHRAPGSRRKRGTSKPAVLAALGVAILAVGTGVAIDRLVLSETRPEPIAASNQAPQADVPAPGTDLDRQRSAGGGATPPAAPSESAPPLKEMPKRDAEPSPSPDTSESSSPDGSRPGGGTAAAPGSSVTETAVALLTNKERAAKGCPALRIDARLVRSARAHSRDMAANDYFSHTSRNGDSPWKRMEEAGYPSPGAENIAKGYPTAAAVVEGWMNSPGHRANILNCDLRAIGVGMATGGGGPYWTQNFGWK
ncbi:CAP domain-containing protein [Actinomadura sp. 21ATH]|uniref:CAP domain-containing protein n=1 Tax=Actinomadura sp. 21ATH TaxID=1735444 RepID=UPI0035C1AA19